MFIKKTVLLKLKIVWQVNPDACVLTRLEFASFFLQQLRPLNFHSYLDGAKIEIAKNVQPLFNLGVVHLAAGADLFFQKGKTGSDISKVEVNVSHFIIIRNGNKTYSS